MSDDQRLVDSVVEELKTLRAENAKLREERHELKNELAKWLHYWRDKDLKAVEEKNVKLRAALKDLIEDHEYMTDTDAEEDNMARAAARAALKETVDD